jgi:hypothetical protein
VAFVCLGSWVCGSSAIWQAPTAACGLQWAHARPGHKPETPQAEHGAATAVQLLQKVDEFEAKIVTIIVAFVCLRSWVCGSRM